MKKYFYFTAVLMFGLVLLSCTKTVPPPAPLYPVPTEKQLAWHEMELNAFVHFTTNTFTDLEWGYGDESPSVFNPTAFDANQWTTVLSNAGFKGLILTCKHHDGFCLWPSEFTEHTIAASPYKNGNGDIVNEVSKACKKQGIKFGVYLSPWDRNHSEYGNSEYITYYRNQLSEIFSNYGPVFEMWFDGANGGDGYYGGANETRKIDKETYYDWPKTIRLVKDLDTNTLFFSDAGPDIRWCGNEQGHIQETNWNLLSTDTIFAGKTGITDLLNTGSEDGKNWIPAEVNTSIRPGWFYHASEDDKVKSPEDLFKIYMESVGRGSTLLLNFPPDRRGLFHENDVRSIEGFRAILDSVFANNLADNAKAVSNTVRGNSDQFDAINLTDGNKETYWATDDDVFSASTEITLEKPAVINYVLIQEYLKLGQRVKKFKVEAMINGTWSEVANGTTIGYKRILKIDPVQTSSIRLVVEDSKACIALSNIELY
jgi:alpha-L-fucosidase